MGGLSFHADLYEGTAFKDACARKLEQQLRQCQSQDEMIEVTLRACAGLLNRHGYSKLTRIIENDVLPRCYRYDEAA